MPELGPYGSVRGARGNSRPYRESERRGAKTALLTQRRSSGLLDDFIRECEHRERDVEAKSLGSRERR